MYQLKEGQEENFKNICSKWGINEAFWENVKDLEFTSPKPEYVFNAFKIGTEKNNGIITPKEVKVLILGQDPYPDSKKAQGFAFSVSNSYTKEHDIDDSLLNIFKAIKVYQYKEKEKLIKYFCDISNEEISWETSLKKWAKGGILLLNTALTHENKDTIETHRNAWEPFIKEVIKKIMASEDNKTVIFLWGKKAQETFFKAFNGSDIKKDNIKINITKPDKEDDIKYRRSKSLKIKTSVELIRGTMELGNKQIYLTSHPSDLGVNDGFSEDAPNHFEACDKFLKENIWKNFPEK